MQHKQFACQLQQQGEKQSNSAHHKYQLACWADLDLAEIQPLCIARIGILLEVVVRLAYLIVYFNLKYNVAS